MSKYANPKDLTYDESKENLDYYRQELGEEPEDGFDQNRHKKRKREQTDESKDNEKLLKVSGYDEFIKDSKSNKKFKSNGNENGDGEPKKRF